MDNPCSAEVEQRKSRITGIFNRSAATYDQIGPHFFTDYGCRLVELAQIPLGAQVLDVATGRGAVLFPAAERVGPAGKVIGIDLSEAMVAATIQELLRRGLANSAVRLMDGEALQFPDAVFDVVLGGFCLFFFPQLAQALAEIHRVLKPRGRLVVSTWGIGDLLWQSLDDVIKAYLPPEPESAEEAASPPGPDFETPQGMEAILQAAGFGAIQVVSESRSFLYASEEEWWLSRWSYGTRALLERIESTSGPDSLAKFKTEIFVQLQAFKQPDGIHHVIPALFTLATKESG